MEQQQQLEAEGVEEQKRQLEKELELTKERCESLDRESREAARLREEMEKLDASYTQLRDQVNVEHEIGEHAEEVSDPVPPSLSCPLIYYGCKIMIIIFVLEKKEGRRRKKNKMEIGLYCV